MRAFFERYKRFIVPALAVLATFGITVAVTSGEDGTTVTLTLPKVAPALPQGDTEAAGPLPTGDPAESALRDETPANPDTTTRPVAPVERKAAGPELPTGGAQNYSCRRDFSGNVYSSRNGATARELHLHYTVSPNVRGWGDVLGIQSYFIRSRVGSSHFIVDFEGNCLQMVPISEKSWTAGAANPIAISWEIIATGRETTAEWLNSPLIKNGILSEMLRDQGRANGIPLVFVDPIGCSFPPGWTDHNHLECGNNHTDVAPHFPFATFTRKLHDGAEPQAPPLALKRCRQHGKYTAIYVKLRKRAKEQGSLHEYGTKKLKQVIGLRKRTTYYFTKNHRKGTENWDCQPNGTVTIRALT